MPRIRVKSPVKKPVATSILRPFTFCPCRRASRQNGGASKSGRFRLFRRRSPSLSLRVGSCTARATDKRRVRACRRNTPTAPALAPHTCAVSPTFRYGAFFFVASALADVPSARLTLSATENAAANWERTTLAPACAARPTASVDMPSWRRIQNSQGHTPKPSQFCLPKVSFPCRKNFLR